MFDQLVVASLFVSKGIYKCKKNLKKLKFATLL